MAVFWVLAWLAVLAYVSLRVVHRRRYELAAKVPGPTLWLPGLGHIADSMYHYGLSGIDWFIGYYKRYGNVYRMWIGTHLFIVTSHPDDIEAIVTNPALIDKGNTYSLLQPWLGDGLLLLGGKKWHARRKMLTPTFHFRILEQFVEVFNDKGEILQSKLAELAGKGPVDVRPYISKHALDVICETAMGTAMNAQLQEDSEYVHAVKLACKGVDDRHVFPWLAYDAIFRLTQSGKDFFNALDIIHGTTRKVIASRKLELQNELKQGGGAATDEGEADIGTKTRKMFIDQLLTMHLQGADLSEKDIFDEVNTFMFEGHDTTMTSVCFTLFLLAKHPEVQDRVAEELSLVLGDETRYTSAQLGELKYLEAVIKESLRLYPSVPVFFRECREEFPLPSGYTVPAGATIFVNGYVAHHDEKNFKDPFKFDPDRFLPGSEAKRHHFAYIPFSAGYRNCIGQRFAMLSMKATLARVLRSFRVAPASADASLVLDLQVVLTAKDGVHLVVERRQ